MGWQTAGTEWVLMRGVLAPRGVLSEKWRCASVPPPRAAPTPGQPAANRKVIAVSEKQQGDEGSKNRQIYDLIAIDRKRARLVEGEGVKKSLPPSGHRESVHDKQAAVAEQAQYPDQPKQAQGNLNIGGGIDCASDSVTPSMFCARLRYCPGTMILWAAQRNMNQISPRRRMSRAKASWRS